MYEILKYPEHVDIVADYGEYSDQEAQMVKGIKRAAEFVQAHHSKNAFRPTTKLSDEDRKWYEDHNRIKHFNATLKQNGEK